YTLPLIGIGALLQLLGRGRWTDLGLSLSGFGILFLGLRTLQLSMTDGADMFNLEALPIGGIGAHLFTMLLGLLLSTLLPSSGAAISSTLTAFDAVAIDHEQGGGVIVWPPIGTTLARALTTIEATSAPRHPPLAYILLNLITGLIAILL